MSSLPRTVHSSEEFLQAAVLWLEERIRQSLTHNVPCLLGLSGGATPLPIYRELSRRALPWERVAIFLLDERYVPPDHPESNYGAIRRCFEHVPVRITTPDVTLSIDAAVQEYEHNLADLWQSRTPDITVLGIGTDGHIASLFPPLSDALLRGTALVAHTIVPGDPPQYPPIHDRITLTLPSIASCKSHLVLLSGEKKKRTWEEMTESSEGKARWPLKAVLGKEDCEVVGWW